ncbi:uncharacterized protein E0L32_005490 [Thyridium curvatum]|uniref:beta-galactosidase n=1 Tax=Thyridium curvatum TaxID=1093900 RepID=A0A507B6L0_9PEZI|nr:uncharacterized protein E0L32_005490 [Thyridium curvatum]TPX14294.1 hypothetical protein E0L32_005490 [Thyridium curvatum]
MRFLSALVAAVGWLSSALATSNNLTDLVTWDKYSLSVNGTRVFINIYIFWSYHSPSKGVFDFESPGKDLQKLFDYAKEAGLWVVTRAGPYCNVRSRIGPAVARLTRISAQAETNGGGLALWGSDGSMGNLRTSDETYHQAWLPWISAVGKIIARNQITEGGPVILNQVENELQETRHDPADTKVVYMEQLKAAFRDAGIVVPLAHNEKGMRSQSWSTDYQDVGGAVNVYGLDSYPGGLSCTNADAGFKVVRTYYQWFQNYSFTQPSYVPEFEGGWFSAWGADVFYDQCATEHDPAFADVYYKNNIGQRITMQNIYMTYGGTNWGHSAAPVVYTSYDYSAPLRETRQQTTKLLQTKLVNMFSGSSPDLLKTYMVGNGTGFRVSSNAIWTWVLKNPDTGATFTVVQQDSTPSRADVSFSVDLDTSAGMITVPNVALNGRQSKILVTDYSFGAHTLLYASSDVATHGAFGRDDSVLVMYLKEGQTGEFAFKGEANLTFATSGPSDLTSSTVGSRQVFTYTQAAGKTAVRFSSGALLYLLDQPTAWQLWTPSTSSDPHFQPDKQILVLGPYLVRSASLSGSTLRIRGDTDAAVTLEAYVGSSSSTEVKTIEWNGKSLPATRTGYGAYTADIPGPGARRIDLPSLKDLRWRAADGLPEADPAYDDSRWTVCNKTSTLSPAKPLTLPVLFSSDYGLYTGAKIYRGAFSGSAAVAGVNITASGGLAFGWSAWLNGVFVGGHPGSASLTTTTAALAFPPSALRGKGEGDNVLTVLVDYHGHDQTSTAKGVENPRGILGAALVGRSARCAPPKFKTWKIAGNAGGAAGYIDPVRGPMNEGGLHAERLGWHLPGFDAAASPAFNNNHNNNASDDSPLGGGLAAAGAGLRFYTATLDLALDADLDAPLGIELSCPPGTVARVVLWVNGYQYGKYVPHIGPQARFPVPPGVLNTRGANSLAVSVWAQTERGARLDGLRLFSYGVYESGFDFGRDWSHLQPGWSDRSQYA